MTMTVLQIEERTPPKRFALWEMGFRPFFLLASLYAAVSVGLWAAVYFHGAQWVHEGVMPTYWHAHELVYGYGFAVVAGFLLTAVSNWTNRQTINGWKLVLLTALWILGRLLYLFHAPWLITAVVETLFALGLLVAVSVPMYQVKQWNNLTIFASKVVTLAIGNLLFYLGMAGELAEGMRWGLYTGLYLIVALIFTMGRRVIPFFIERGIGYEVQLTNSKVVDLTSLIGLLGLWIAELVVPNSIWTIVFAAVTASAQMVRLYWWYAKGLWKKPLIWVLWSGLAWVTIGLLMKVVAEVQGIPAYAAWHAIAYGGIGLVTLGMMSRATLGHTGRSVFEPPKSIGLLFLGLLIGAVIRSFGPVLLPDFYQHWIAVSQLLWIVVFTLFLLLHAPMWIGPSKRR